MTLLAISKPGASIPVIFSASLSSTPPSLISSMLAIVIEFHTERICDADTRWFCACQMTFCISPSLPPSLLSTSRRWLCCQNWYQSITVKHLRKCMCLLSFTELHELNLDFEFFSLQQQSVRVKAHGIQM